MAESNHPAESDGNGSSCPPERIEDPESLPGGRSERGVAARGPRREYTQDEAEALLAELTSSGERVADFAVRHGLHSSTLYAWLRRVRAGASLRASGRAARRCFSPEELRAALEAWAKSGLTANHFAKLWGISAESLRSWRTRFELGGPQALEPKAVGRPRGKGRSQLPEPLQAASPTWPTLSPAVRVVIVGGSLRWQGRAMVNH
jgi:transposase-like protein